MSNRRGLLFSLKFKRNLVYAGLVGLVLGGYITGLFYVQSLFKYTPDVFIIVNSLGFLIAALGFYPLEQKLQALTDNFFYKKRSGYHKTISNILRQMISCLELNDLSNLVVDSIYNEMKVNAVAFFLHDPVQKKYTLLKQKNYELFSELSETADLVNLLIEKQKILSCKTLSKTEKTARGLFNEFKAEMLIPFLENQQLRGFMLLDKKLSGDPFLKEDLNLLEALRHQIVIGLQNTSLYETSQNKVRELTTLFEISRLISSTLEAEKILKSLIKIVVEMVDVDRGILFLYNNDKKELYSATGYGAADKDILGITLEVDDSVLGRVFKAGKPVLIPHTTRNTEYVKRLGVQSYVVVPMKAKDKVIGLLAVDNASSRRSLEKLNLDFLMSLGNQMAVAIENAKLYEEAKQKVKELSKLNENILRLQTYNENVLKTMPSGVISVDNEGRIKTFNKTAESITGFSFNEVEGRLISELWSDRKYLDLLQKEVSNQEINYQDKQENSKILNISTKALQDSTGRQIGWLTVLTDLSELKLLEKQVRRSDRVTALGTMVAGIAHEIKNPLTSMKLFIQLMEEQKDNPKFWEEYGSIIRNEVSRLENIVENFLGFARTKETDLQPVSLKEIMDNMYKLIRTQSSKENVDIMLEVDPELYVKADIQKMMQVFLNLVLNAIQAMPANRQEKGRIIILSEVDPKGELVRIAIADNGLGIPKENLEKLFTPFFTTKPKGTGLGLSIVHKIVEEHDGQIQVESKVGKGTAFYITLPLVKQKVKA